MILPLRPALLAALLLAVLHGAVAIIPDGPLEPATNLVLYAVNLYGLYCAWLALRDGSARRTALFSTGYLLLFLLVFVLLKRESLFILLILVYVSVFRHPLLLCLFVIFTLSYVVFQPYAFETFLPLGLATLAIFGLRARGASGFLVACLGAGLVMLALVLLPILHLLLQDSPQTLLFALERAEVREAIGMTLASSGLATLIVALWGVPLAYALARGRFRGQALVESLIDLPILVPQSVAGIALLALLGPGAPLGLLLDSLGLGLAGRFMGIVVAQVFVACPFLIKTAVTAFEGVPEHLEGAARTLGARPARTFFWVALPLASRGIWVGLILCWARAVSEFGTLLLFAPHPLTAPVLVHNEFLQAGLSEARPLAVLLLTICLWIFIVFQFGKTLLPSASRGGAAGGVRR